MREGTDTGGRIQYLCLLDAQASTRRIMQNIREFELLRATALATCRFMQDSVCFAGPRDPNDGTNIKLYECFRSVGFEA